MSMKLRILLLLVALLSAACAIAPNFAYRIPEQSEGASGRVDRTGWSGRKFAVAAANPLATDAGYQVLKAGGTAVDAAIAVQMVLALVEPQSSGIGGGAFLLHFNGKKIDAYDGRETAPASADEKLFIAADGRPLPFFEAVVGGRSVGAPGTVRMLEMAHREHGRLPWARLFEPALILAEQGFSVSPRLHTLLSNEAHLKKDPTASAYFYDSSGKAWPIGHVLKNPALASVLRRVATEGSKALHEGEIAQDIVNKVQGHPTNPGRLSLVDLASYQAKKREAFCTDYRAAGAQGGPRDYRICGMPPPSSGAIAIGQILGILSNTIAADVPLQDGLPGAAWLHQYTEASRLAYADRALYVADPDFINAPAGNWQSLVDPAYLAARAELIGRLSMKTAKPGQPGPGKSAFAPMTEQPEFGTSHISIVDGNGRAVAMTTTIEDGFGSRQMVRGFLLNNELTDFSFLPADASGQPIANRVQAGKRPRSSMSPTLILDKSTGALVMSAGSPGGAMIIHYTAKTIYGILNWGLKPQQAINLPNFGSLNGPTLLEEKRFPEQTVEVLKAKGHEIREQNLTSGLQAIERTARGLFGGADLRREGIVMGD